MEPASKVAANTPNAPVIAAPPAPTTAYSEYVYGFVLHTFSHFNTKCSKQQKKREVEPTKPPDYYKKHKQ